VLEALSRQSFVASEVDSDGRIDIFSSARIVVEDRGTVVGTIIALDGQRRRSPHFSALSGWNSIARRARYAGMVRFPEQE